MNERLGWGTAKCFLKAFISQLGRNEHAFPDELETCTRQKIN